MSDNEATAAPRSRALRERFLEFVHRRQTLLRRLRRLPELARSRQTQLSLLLVLIVAANLVFDIWVAPVTARLNEKARAQAIVGDPTYVRLPERAHAWGRWLYLETAFPRLTRHVLATRFALTALPLLIIALVAMRGPMRERHFAAAIAVGALVFATKTVLWRIVWLLADVATGF